MQQERRDGNSGLQEGDDPAGEPVRVIYYTDPLCCWSWAMEPAWRRLRYEFGERLVYRYRMGGLISDWDTFRDPLNAIHRPAQMGPYWLHVSRVSGMPIDECVWMEDPPLSSYPACLAVKAAERQGLEHAERYLRRLREAVMVERRNIAHRKVLIELASEVSAQSVDGGGLDVACFTDDLDAEETRAAFREDLKEARFQGIGRFPTLVLLRPDGKGLILTGYRPYPVLRAALSHLMPDLEPQRSCSDPAAYASYWGSLTPQEMAEATGDPLPVSESGAPR